MCYNRFRYYSPDSGTYISQDPIGLRGSNPNFYAYVPDSNSWIDPFGLDCSKKFKTNDIGKHSDLSPGKNRLKGHKNIKEDNFVQFHHFIQQKWVKENMPNASKVNKNSSAILLESASGMPHAKISAAQRARRAVGGYGNSLKNEFNTAYKEMIDSGVPSDVAKNLAKKAYKYFDSLGGF
nr:RHS repeat-associated core domain-containing protein [Cellulophaga lytica]